MIPKNKDANTSRRVTKVSDTNIFQWFLKILCTLLVLATTGCDLYPQDEFEEEYVIESFLVANRTFSQVRISRTMPIDQQYDFREAAVNDANVEVRRLDENGNIVNRIPYYLKSPGVYAPHSSEKVQPTRVYELYVTFSNTSEEVSATTFVPGDFSSENNQLGRIPYQSPEQVVITTTRSFYPGRQSFFIFSVEALNPKPEYLTPFYKDQVDDSDENIETFYTNSSGIVNEENYEENEEGTLTLRLPWLAVAFYGENYIIANAIDDNMYDFYRTQNLQGGGGTLPPGELQNAKYNIKGGIGVFGSLASDTVKVFIDRN